MRLHDDTIAAISTPPGEGAIGIVRISGNLSLSILRSIFRNPSGGSRTDFASHLLCYGRIVTDDNLPIDEVLAVYMKAPRTYTREDVVEIHCHGGTASVREILQAVVHAGARPAEPGEFTLRAFLNGRIDLTQSEAVMDVIGAKTKRSLLCAARQLGGGLGRRITEMRERLIRLLAHLEAWIDFPEDDIPAFDLDVFRTGASAIADEAANLLATWEGGRALREGISVAIAGRPNVGKSSLLNLLLAEERAIVTDIPGTTRDTIEETLSIDGLPVRLIDTAGIREAGDMAEAEGIRRSRAAMDQAEIVILVLDGSEPLHASDMELASETAQRKSLLVINKSDLPGAWTAGDAGLSGRAVINLSARTGEGVQALMEAISALAVRDPASTEGIVITRLRHKTALEGAVLAINRFLALLEAGEPPELLSLDLRDALACMDEILGVTAVDDILDVIFSDFCIGK